MIRKNLYIVVLLALFFGTYKALHAIGFWAIAGLPEPSGYLQIGILFLAILFVLQNGLFAPYLRVIDERELQTEGKRKAAEKTREEAQAMIEKYRRSIEETRLDATRDRERRALAAEEEEQKTIAEAKRAGSEQLKGRLVQFEKEATGARLELKSTVQTMAQDIVERVLASGGATGGLSKSVGFSGSQKE